MERINPNPCTRHRHHRRGSAYVLVLAVSMIVTVIGLSAITVTRIQRRTIEGTHDAHIARNYAISAIDLALLETDVDPSWRKTYTHDTWVADRALGRGTIKWKLVDTVDTDLDNGDDHGVKVLAWGMVGGTTQKASVLLEAKAETNLFGNPDMEDGTSDWSVSGTGDIESSSVDPHGGVSSLHIFNRANYWSVPAQAIDVALFENGVTYDFTIWVKIDSTQQITLELSTVASGSGAGAFESDPTLCGAGTWTEVTGTITPSWTGDLTSATVSINTQTSHQLWLDDALLTSASQAGSMQIVSGSWAKEVD